MSLEIIYEDDYIVCVNKPNNVVVHHAYHSRNVSEETSLLELLKEFFDEKLYPIHRLDRKTSGIILLAKKTKFVSKFQDLFTEDAIKKTYLGIVRGHAPKIKVIDSPVKGRDSEVYKEAETHLKTIHTIILDVPVKPYNSSRYSLIQLTPKTGRLHQLRIHMNKISYPLIGDPKYGDKNHNMMFAENFGWKNLFLHAYALEFVHPFSDKNIVLTTNLPKDWKSLFKTFEFNLIN